MRYKFYLRIILAIVLAYVGALVAKGGAQEGLFAQSTRYLTFAAILAFGALGYILPDILELAGKAGVASLGKQIAKNIQGVPAASINVARMRFRRRKKKTGLPQLVCDTSALIDGRIVDVARSGFVWGSIIVIPSVIAELQKLSDNFDDIKRGKGRRGLDILFELQKLAREKPFSSYLKVEVPDTEPDDKEVDDKLVHLAKQLKGRIITVDYNLGKVAKVKNVPVANLNELANAVKSLVLPEDKLRIKISSLGRERTQGVGYLGDGTMVVVAAGAGMKGKTVDVVVHKVLQTSAGKMIFSKLTETYQES